MDENKPNCCRVERARRFNLFGFEFGPKIVTVEIKAYKKSKSAPREWYCFWFDSGGMLIDSNVGNPNAYRREARV